jgi:hypothetical protein
MKLFKMTLTFQSIYYLLTALWPIIDIKSFMIVTGYKTDTWLVKTVGALLIPMALTMATHLFLHIDHLPVVILCFTAAVAFAVIDFYYAANDVILDIYMVDGIIQLALICSWSYIFLTGKHRTCNTP